MTESGQITVRVLKYDGSEYRSWSARLARREGPLIVLDAVFDIDVQHHLLGDIQRGTRTIEYYWLDRWYNIFRFLKDDGETRLYYCNINMPPSFENDLLTYIDLDIDVLVQADLSYRVLDWEEFETNAARYGYTDEIKSHAHEAVDDLITMIRTHDFPFIESPSFSSVPSVVN